MMRPTDRLIQTAAFVLAACLNVVANAQGGPPPAMVVVDAAKTEEVMLQREVIGEIRSMRRALVAAQIEGLILDLPLRAGDLVEQGDVIARMDDELARVEADQAQAGIEAAQGLVSQREAELDLNKRDLERAQQLDSKGSLSAGELDRYSTEVAIAGAELAQAKADLLQAKATLARAKKNLADKTIRAPFTGKVVRRSAEVGEWITPGDAVLELVSVTDLEAWVDVPEHLVRFIDASGTPVPVTIPGLGTEGGQIEAKLIAVVPDADTLSRMFPIRLSVPNKDGKLKPGMSLKASVPTGEKAQRLTVHKDAILRDAGGEYVYIAAPFQSEANPAIRGQAAPARVRTVFAFADRVVIQPGQVQDGSLIVTEGNERMFPTQPLIFTNNPATAGSGAAPKRQPASGQTSGTQEEDA